MCHRPKLRGGYSSRLRHRCNLRLQCCHRSHSHCRRLCSHHRRRRGHRFGCHCNHSLQGGCWCSHSRRFSGAVADVAGVECSNAGVDIVADAIAIGIGRTRTTALAQHVIREARPIVVCCCRVVVAGKGVGAPFDFIAVTHAIGIGVCRAVTTADAEGIGLIAIAITVSRGDAGAATVVDFSGAVADVAGVECSNAGVDIVADAIAIGIGGAGSTALPDVVGGEAGAIVIGAQGVVVAGEGVGAPSDLIGVAHAIADRYRPRRSPPQTPRASAWLPSQSQSPVGMSGAAAVVDLSGAVADAAGVECSNAGVDIVADAIAIGIGGAGTAALPARHRR